MRVLPKYYHTNQELHSGRASSYSCSQDSWKQVPWQRIHRIVPCRISQGSNFLSIGTEFSFASASDKICLSITEVLLFSTVVNLVKSKHLCNWVILNAVLIPPFLAKALIHDRKTSITELFEAFSNKIVEYQTRNSKHSDR